MIYLPARVNWSGTKRSDTLSMKREEHALFADDTGMDWLDPSQKRK